MNNANLLAAARAARLRAYAPYSGFKVGAALLTADGALFTGSNIENASYSMAVCAERVALFSAVHAGYSSFSKIAIAADSSPPASPCGACRQVLWEQAGNIDVIMGNLQGETAIKPASELLPLPFGLDCGTARKDQAQIEEEADMWRLPVTFSPVAHILNSYQTTKEIPQNYKELLSQVVVNPELEEGLYRLEEEEKVVIIAHLHRSRGYKLKGERSGRGGGLFGVFSCRTPFRPNALAQSTVELVEVNKNILTVRGLDLISGTPVIDIKTDYR